MGDERVLGGRYRLGGRLGQGGMAEVRLGLDVRLGRPVAVKRLTGDLARDPAARALFRSEARSAASLNHPGIVKVFDTGEDTDPITGVWLPTSSWSLWSARR
jgi:serine/threonine protein kinase